MSHTVELAGAIVFALALLHTFVAKRFERLAHRHPRHAGLFHLLGEVEVVFGFWALVLLIAMAVLAGPALALDYAQSREFTEPLFVFTIMVIAASRPILDAVAGIVQRIARVLPVDTNVAVVWLSLTLIPLLGSFMTEPAAMTLAALILRDRLFCAPLAQRWKYLSLGMLFVNVSIGGTLTAYAAPPVLMVAAAWGWDSAFMAAQFGWKAAVAVFVNATVLVALMRGALAGAPPAASAAHGERVPAGVTLVHVGFLVGVVLGAHHPVVFIGLLLFFLGFTVAYERHQSPLMLRENLLVAFFLGGLVVLGGLQQWWLQPIVASMDAYALYAGALGLTAVMDNAAITYLGSLIAGMPDGAKYMLVSGAVAGGGLTVIANAPNPAGLAIVRRGFEDESVSVAGLLAAAIGPTLVATGALLLL
ncbi:putative Na+/H+ antiporter [Burkholderia cenocepacia]|uniref:putative Na+/H+ antiporter n=1 Tax=Burkholderia cenocepacia TaxID=95486 RepID=UPI002AB6C8EC|nr:putative Na+/H+ antiporter [Burkholderia cenocepacia]